MMYDSPYARNNMQPIMKNRQGSSFIQVFNRQSVEQFYVAPGNELLFMYEEEPVIAKKRVDVAGVSVIDEYDLVPRVHKANPEYVTREEFESFTRRFANEPAFDQPVQPVATAVTTGNDADFAANAAAGNDPASCATANDARA